MRRLPSLTAGGFALVLLAATTPAAWSFDVTSCGQSVPAGERGVLTTDLVCDADLPAAVDLGRSSAFLLNAHSITGAKIGVACHGRCRVTGPGELIGQNAFGVAQLGTKGDFHAPVRVEHLAVHDAVGNGTGIQVAQRGFVLDDLTLERNAVGVCCGGTFRGTNLTIRDNRDVGVEAESMDMRGFVVSGSPVGIYTLPHGAFLRRQSPRLFDGALSGNGVDIRSLSKPVLHAVSCSHSESLDHVPWGVCSDD
jgi:hypothetical protein